MTHVSVLTHLKAENLGQRMEEEYKISEHTFHKTPSTIPGIFLGSGYYVHLKIDSLYLHEFHSNSFLL